MRWLMLLVSFLLCASALYSCWETFAVTPRRRFMAQSEFCPDLVEPELLPGLTYSRHYFAKMHYLWRPPFVTGRCACGRVLLDVPPVPRKHLEEYLR